ncbi:ABC transporter permease [Winogradskyella bathintestinalis]|uniref:ABC transporter permease n=1 Tax=Winogradskyella bathintestinalis TaxID=3035208 RepID=A0ABT7ZV35_9FLAO|nr:ABC transporter permease [Winogradskyella bathintestinalis]MDN3492578.1 ABC transporter permease [Winogradskyella bathintestinalis]
MNLLYFKIAFRYLLKNKLYSFINIIGLSLGIATFIIISLYVSYEKSYDSFVGSDTVYRVYMDYIKGDIFEAGDAQTYNLTGPTLNEQFPEVVDNVRLYRLDKVTFVKGDKIIEQPNGALVDASYFDIFDTPLLQGDISNFKKPNTVILSESLAEKLFGDYDPLLKTVSVFYGSDTLLKVVGIFPDMPETTHMKLNYLISFETLETWEALKSQAKLNWNQNNFFTYIKVSKHTNFEALQDKITSADFENDPDERHNIERITDIHLYSNKPYEAETNGSGSRVKFLTIIAIIILLLSWLNYINLSTVKSLERSREVGIRKVAGAQRSQLILQSLIESMCLFLLALVTAIIWVIVLLPIFNDFVGKSLILGVSNSRALLPFAGLMFLGSLLAGFYPAVILSNFSPVKALKGKIVTSSSKLNIRKGLITVQFFATIILIIGTLVVSKQNNFLKEQSIGAELSQVLALKGEVLETIPDSTLAVKIKVFENELKNLSFVNEVARTATYPGDGYDNLSSSVGIEYPDGTLDERQIFYGYAARPNYFKVVDIKFVAGEAFKERTGKQLENIVINEKFAQQMGYSNPEDIINQQVKFWGETCTITGVIRDYHHFGLKSEVLPLMIFEHQTYDNVLVKLNTSSGTVAGMQTSLDEIKSLYKSIFPNSILNYSFLDKKFEAQYAEDQKFGTAFQIFTALAIFIAALGLFGLTSYMCLQRRKEIGIRKVTGASVFQILKLLNKDFVKLVVIAFIIAIPVGWYIMKTWLQEFAYKTDLSWWIFALSAIIAILIALITVSIQSVKAAIANPVKCLKTE